MDNFNFKINNRIEVYVEDNSYRSSIQDVTKDHIAISIPFNNGMYVALENGQFIEVIYYEGKDLYRFFTKVIGRKVDKIPVFLIAHPDSIEKHQRRNFVRVPIIRYIDCTKRGQSSNVDLKYLDFDKEENVFRATLLDISGGGTKIRLKEDVSLNDILLLYIPVEEEKIIVEGKVIRLEKDMDNYSICGVSFLDVDLKTRDKIIRLTFEIMRNMRKKGMKED